MRSIRPIDFLRALCCDPELTKLLTCLPAAETGRQAETEEDNLMRCFYRKFTILVALCLATVLLAGCGIHFHFSKDQPGAEELLANRELIADPLPYSEEGSYAITFRYEKGGFAKMDLSQAYVAYHPITLQDQIDTIVGDDKEEIPPLPFDAQEAVNDVLGIGELKKIAVIKVLTVDDKTLTVSFKDTDDPIRGKEYFFIIPNAGLAGSVIPE